MVDLGRRISCTSKSLLLRISIFYFNFSVFGFCNFYHQPMCAAEQPAPSSLPILFQAIQITQTILRLDLFSKVFFFLLSNTIQF